LIHSLTKKIKQDCTRFLDFGFGFFDLATVILVYSARPLALCPTPNLEGQVSVCMSPSDKVDKLYPQAAGSLFVTYGSVAMVEVF
jgi:hypothetical protein